MRTLLISTLALSTIATTVLADEPTALTSKQMAQARLPVATVVQVIEGSRAADGVADVVSRPLVSSAVDAVALRRSLLTEFSPAQRTAEPSIRVGASPGRLVGAASKGASAAARQPGRSLRPLPLESVRKEGADWQVGPGFRQIVAPGFD